MHKFQIISNDYSFLLSFAYLSNAFLEVVDFEQSIFCLCYDSEELKCYWNERLISVLTVIGNVDPED
jgi:hypothetical protein